jgi:hypothetical protein
VRRNVLERRLPDDVAERAHHPGSRATGGARRAHDLRLELPLAEGEVVDDDDVGPDPLHRLGETPSALRHHARAVGPIRTDETAVDPLEAGQRQPPERLGVGARHRSAAVHEVHLVPGRRERGRDGVHAHEVSDARQMLRVTERPHASARRREPE